MHTLPIISIEQSLSSKSRNLLKDSAHKCPEFLGIQYLTSSKGVVNISFLRLINSKQKVVFPTRTKKKIHFLHINIRPSWQYLKCLKITENVMLITIAKGGQLGEKLNLALK